MLCQFSFQNFKSYKDETTFDLQATTISEFKDSLIKRAKCSELLPISVIYGPNGGGKSNLLQALASLITTVVKPVHELGNTRKSIVIQQRFLAEPFLYDAVSTNEPTEFQIFFRTDEYEYRYYLALLKDEVYAETLDRKTFGGKKPARIFYREGEEITLGTILKKESVNTKVNEKMPLTIIFRLLLMYRNGLNHALFVVIAIPWQKWKSCFPRIQRLRSRYLCF